MFSQEKYKKPRKECLSYRLLLFVICNYEIVCIWQITIHFLLIQYYCNFLQSKSYQAPKNFKSLKTNLLISYTFDIHDSRQWQEVASFTNCDNMENHCRRPMLRTALLVFGFQLRRNCGNNVRFVTTVLSIALFLYIDCWTLNLYIIYKNLPVR